MCISTCISSGGTCQFCPIVHLVTRLSAKFLHCKSISFPFVITRHRLGTMGMNGRFPTTSHSAVRARVGYSCLGHPLPWGLQKGNFPIPLVFRGWCPYVKKSSSYSVFVQYQNGLKISFLFFPGATRSQHDFLMLKRTQAWPVRAPASQLLASGTGMPTALPSCRVWSFRGPDPGG